VLSPETLRHFAEHMQMYIALPDIIVNLERAGIPAESLANNTRGSEPGTVGRLADCVEGLLGSYLEGDDAGVGKVLLVFEAVLLNQAPVDATPEATADFQRAKDILTSHLAYEGYLWELGRLRSCD